MIRKIDEEKPQVPLYDQLPQRVKSSILEQGEKTFTEQVTNNKDAITNQALKAFNQDKILGMFTELNPEGILQNIIGGAGTQFLSNLGLGGSIGGMASNLGGLANNFGISNPFSNFM